MVIQGHGIDRPDDSGNGCLYIAPVRLRVVGNTWNVATGIIGELPVADPDDIAERVFVEVTVLDGIERNVLLRISAASGPDHAARCDIPDVEVREFLRPLQPDLIELSRQKPNHRFSMLFAERHHVQVIG